jgi:alpha-mannosidase
MPYDSFWWQGIDGTRVLTHFSPIYNYNAAATPKEILGGWRAFQQKAEQTEILMSFGYGDGGGGPTREMLENIAALNAFPAAPQTFHDTVGAFFARMEAESGPALPTWDGELYLELHRGTYTTQSRNKRANRKSEFLLHDAEFLAAWAAALDADYAYPNDDITAAWKLICLNQFHDIIPGSSITTVYTESQEQYATVRGLAARVRAEALAALGKSIGGALLAVNPTSFARRDLAFWPGTLDADQGLALTDGTPVASQTTEDGTWIALGDLPPYSAVGLQIVAATGAAGENPLTATPTLLENAHIRVELNADGDITRIYDKRYGREVVPAGALAGQFQAFEDRPLNWDAWDIDIHYTDRHWTSDPAESIRVIEAGPLRATLEIKRRVLNSAYTQRISLGRDSAQIDFDTEIDWRERHILLKVAFPVDILAPAATYEIQYGNVERPTHHNTSWDWARFETCAQKWVDLSEDDYGVSLLNDCKYGHDIRANVIRLSLLRGSTDPDPVADQGAHRFAYSLLPHAGDWRTETVAAAYALNDPLIVAKSGGGAGAAALPAFISVDAPNIVIETVKRAEDGDGVIVRLYECMRRRGTVALTAGFDLASATLTNLLEDDGEAVEVRAGRQIALPYRPYQIITLRLRGA